VAIITPLVYSIPLDLPNGLFTIYYSDNLQFAINNSAIVTATYVTADLSAQTLTVVFADVPQPGEQNILDGGSGMPYNTDPAGGLIASTSANPSSTITGTASTILPGQELDYVGNLTISGHLFLAGRLVVLV
jgi:hypothetical protein